MNLRQCIMCRKPVWDASMNTTNAEFGPQYCQCLTIKIHLTDYAVEALKSISRQLAPAKTDVPRVYYDALSDEEVSL